MSKPRLPYATLSKAAYEGLVSTSQALSESPLGTSLVELVYLRVSQINGCSFCLGMHSEILRKAGVAQGKLDRLAGWRISELFDARERAALAWTESLTYLANQPIPDALYDDLGEHFDAKEICDLTLAVSLMNAFNRLAVSMKV